MSRLDIKTWSGSYRVEPNVRHALAFRRDWLHPTYEVMGIIMFESG